MISLEFCTGASGESIAAAYIQLHTCTYMHTHTHTLFLSWQGPGGSKVEHRGGAGRLKPGPQKAFPASGNLTWPARRGGNEIPVTFSVSSQVSAFLIHPRGYVSPRASLGRPSISEQEHSSCQCNDNPRWGQLGHSAC